MRRLLGTIIGFGAVLATSILVYQAVLPCRVPRTYALVPVDPRFHVTDAEFAKAASGAAAMWNTAAGKEILRGDPHGDIPVATVYDSRQEAVTRLKDLGLRLDQGEQSYEDVKRAYEQQKAAYDAQSRAYQSRDTAFETRKAAYERAVESAQRERGSVTPEQAAALEAERTAVNAQVPVLQREHDALEKQRADLNDVVSVLNRLAAEHNRSAESYNAVGQAIGPEYEAGLYVRSGMSEHIDLYAFSSVQELQSLLAHEFGHALGLSHIDDPAAVMYFRSESGRDALAASDIAAIRERCGIR